MIYCVYIRVFLYFFFLLIFGISLFWWTEQLTTNHMATGSILVPAKEILFYI